jgi:hypothetical protein
METSPTTWINDKGITILRYGLLAGTLVARIEFSEIKATNREMKDLYDFIVSIGLKSKGVLFDGTFTDDNAFAFEGVVKTLVEAGYTVFIHTNGTKYLPFFTKQGTYTIVELTDPEWSTFPVREVHYHLKKGSQVEPVIPAKCMLNYLIPDKDITMKDMLAFITSSKMNWKICPETKKPVIVRLKGE